MGHLRETGDSSPRVWGSRNKWTLWKNQSKGQQCFFIWLSEDNLNDESTWRWVMWTQRLFLTNLISCLCLMENRKIFSQGNHPCGWCLCYAPQDMYMTGFLDVLRFHIYDAIFFAIVCWQIVGYQKFASNTFRLLYIYSHKLCRIHKFIYNIS